MTHAGPIPVGLQLSPHLSVREFLHSSKHPHLDGENVMVWAASPQIRANALRLAVDVFEPIRALVGPLRVTSGFRSDALNRAVDGSGYKPGQKPSAHMDGRAADVIPLEMDLLDAMRRIVKSGIAFEKVIFERGIWIHIQAPRHAEEPKRLGLMWFGGSEYPRFDANDPRVRRVA